MRLCAKCQKLSIVLSLPFNVTLLTSVFKYFLPSFFCTDISVNFIQESPILQFSVAKSRISLSSIQPILGPLMPQKSVFRQKADQCTHCSGALKPTKTLLIILPKRLLKSFNIYFYRFKFQELKAIFSKMFFKIRSW